MHFFMNLQAFLLFKLHSAYFTLVRQRILLHHSSKNVYRPISNFIREASDKNVTSVGDLIYHGLLCKVRHLRMQRQNAAHQKKAKAKIKKML